MTHIVKKQKEVLKRFKRHGENLLDSDGVFKAENVSFVQSPQSPETFDSLGDTYKSRYFRWKAFRDNVDSLLEDTEERLEVLEELQRNAEHVCRDVRLL